MGSEAPSSVRIAADAERMRTVFGRRLAELLESPVEAVRCALTAEHAGEGASRFRYDLRLRRPDDGLDREVALTAVLLHAADAARRNDALLARLAPIPTSAGGVPLPAFWTVPELGMFVQVFPHDERLPALAEVMLDPDAVLSRVESGQRAERIDALAPWRADLIQYRPGKRATVRLTGRAGGAGSAGDGEPHLYAKIYGDRETGRRTYGVLRDLHAGGGERFVVGEPVACLDDGGLLIHPSVPGDPLLDVLRTGEGAAVIGNVARAIAALHLLGVDAVEQPARRDPVVGIADVCAGLRQAFPELATAIDEASDAVLARIGPAPALVPSHGDLKPEHILIDDGRVGFIDFDRFALADPMQDLAYLLFRVVRAGNRSVRPKAGAAALAPVFLDAYFASAPAAWGARLPAQYAAVAFAKAATFADGGSDRGDRATVLRKAGSLIEEARDAASGVPFSRPVGHRRATRRGA